MNDFDLLPPSCLSIKTLHPKDISLLLDFLSDNNSIARIVLGILYENGAEHRGEIHLEDCWEEYKIYKGKILEDYTRRIIGTEDEEEDGKDITEDIKKPKSLKNKEGLRNHYRNALDKYMDRTVPQSRLSKLNDLLDESDYQLCWKVKDGPRRGLFLESKDLPPGIGHKGVAILCPETVQKIYEYFNGVLGLDGVESVVDFLGRCEGVLEAKKYYDRFKVVRTGFTKDKYSLDELETETGFPELKKKWGTIINRACSDEPSGQLMYQKPGRGKSTLAAWTAKELINRNRVVYVIDCKRRSSTRNTGPNLLNIIERLIEHTHFFIVEDIHLAKQEADSLFFSMLKTENVSFLTTCREEHLRYFTETVGLKSCEYLNIVRLNDATLEIARHLFRKYNRLSKLGKDETKALKKALSEQFGGNLSLYRCALDFTPNWKRVVPTLKHAEAGMKKYFENLFAKAELDCIEYAEAVAMICCVLNAFEYGLPQNYLDNKNVFPHVEKAEATKAIQWLTKNSDFRYERGVLAHDLHPNVSEFITLIEKERLEQAIQRLLRKPEIRFSIKSDWSVLEAVVLGVLIYSDCWSFDKHLFFRLSNSPLSSASYVSLEKTLSNAFPIAVDLLLGEQESKKWLMAEYILYAARVLIMDGSCGSCVRAAELLDEVEKEIEKIEDSDDRGGLRYLWCNARIRAAAVILGNEPQNDKERSKLENVSERICKLPITTLRYIKSRERTVKEYKNLK